MNKPDYEKIIEWLALVLKCPVCGNKYGADQTSIIDSKEQERNDSSSIIVHTDCQNCKSSIVFNVSLEGTDLFSVGILTDLNGRDAKHFREHQSITIDEVIGFHKFLQKFDGNFEKVLIPTPEVKKVP